MTNEEVVAWAYSYADELQECGWGRDAATWRRWAKHFASLKPIEAGPGQAGGDIMNSIRELLTRPRCEVHHTRLASYETYSRWATREKLPRLQLCAECAGAFVHGGGAIMMLDVSRPGSTPDRGDTAPVVPIGYAEGWEPRLCPCLECGAGRVGQEVPNE